jgi:cellobiose phosphorylase
MQNKPKKYSWQFIDENGTFRLQDPHLSSYLYFPLLNEAGMMSVVTPMLNGDIKTGQNTFLTQPLSVEDLHNTRSARNFWVYMDGERPWSLTGNSAAQIANLFSEEAESVTLKAGLLWHTLTRENPQLGLRAEITNFVPANEDQVELMRVTITNSGSQPRNLIPTAAIPIFGRSADNLRDHRHVTSLLHRITCNQNGVLVEPTLSFDERGHIPNTFTYAVLGWDDQESPPEGFFPVVEDFIGEGGSLDWPVAIVQNVPPTTCAGASISGYEALGGLRFPAIKLQPGEQRSWMLILTIFENDDSADALLEKYCSPRSFSLWFDQTHKTWNDKLDYLRIHTVDPRFDGWMRWVSSQPIMRRLFGNSFLPYHDYGRGGRGWRDLWQDILALLLIEPENVAEMLLGNFAGVRIDGSNATIIGNHPGEFKADRNEIPRVWMDHGAWPLLTVKLYIDQTGDLGFLLREQTYFKDHLTQWTKVTDSEWQPIHGTQLYTSEGDIYSGSVLEHMLVQHLTAFFNVGEHNNIRLEDADWNDGLDMAPDRGESVAFTALYASNLFQLADLVLQLKSLSVDTISLASELMLLLDRLGDAVDYSSPKDKRQRLAAYFASVERNLSGNCVDIPLKELVADLRTKAEYIFTHLRNNEWVQNDQGQGWFNGYYDNEGQRLEGDHPLGVRMTLTGQVFSLMGGIAGKEQAQKIVQAVDHYLFDPKVGGYRLNTDFGETMLDLGRAFGFAYGHKENGAMFSHMAVMYANALYKRGFVDEGFKVLDAIFQHSVDFPTSRIYPGIPEYFNARGRGMYPYLTGSASWYLLTMITEVFGVRGCLGDLVLQPQLMKQQYDSHGMAGIDVIFAARKLHIRYHNPMLLDFDQATVSDLKIDGESVNFRRFGEKGVILKRAQIVALQSEFVHTISVWLDKH